MGKNDNLSDFKSNTDYAANKAKSGIDDARSTVKDAAERYGAQADNAIDKAEQTYHEVKDVAQQKMGEVETMIRDKPVQSALIAAGIGFVVGALLTR